MTPRFGLGCWVVLIATTLVACGGDGGAGPGKGGSGGTSAAGGRGGAGGGGAGGASGGGGGSTGGGAGTGGSSASAGGSVGGGAGSAGSGGGGGGAGATGAAGTGGSAGSGGSTGAGGGAAGTGGGAGSGGATGSGGSTGAGGSAAGTGGSAGSAGATGGGGGTAGSAGIGGSAGTGGGNYYANCSNGVLDVGENCDDRNRVGGDGCGPRCQIEADWDCFPTGSPCFSTALCGDGKLAVRELCDDGNTQNGDGCDGDCRAINAGYYCPTPGRPCVPICGDGMKVGAEQCDDGNANSGDGCSAKCQIEPGASCSGTPSVCTVAVCGNGVKEGNEGLRLRLQRPRSSRPAARGRTACCSATRPVARSRAPRNRRAARAPRRRRAPSSCGNGTVETGEACDDGNMNSGDGCSSSCTIEAGFMCPAVARSDAETCQSGTGTVPAACPPSCATSRTKRSPAGTPTSSTWVPPSPTRSTSTTCKVQPTITSFSKRYCVPDAAGPAKRNDAVNRAWDIAAATLGANGKPVFNSARPNGLLSECQFIDWNSDGNGGHTPGYTSAISPTAGLTYVDGASGHPMYRGLAPIVSSATTFAQWYLDSTWTGDTHTVKTLELTSATGRLPVWPPHRTWSYGGFFPLDPTGQFPFGGSTAGPGAVRTVGAEALTCNLWPYWFSSTMFGAGRECRAISTCFRPASAAPPIRTACG